MKPTPLLTGWTCRHLGDTAPGKPVTLPHDAMLAEPCLLYTSRCV